MERDDVDKQNNTIQSDFDFVNTKEAKWEP
jgi:hypothetical protein